MPQRPIYALDLRNHGLSPHSTPMTYEAMAADVHKFIQDKGLHRVALLGHSMFVIFSPMSAHLTSWQGRKGCHVLCACPEGGWDRPTLSTYCSRYCPLHWSSFARVSRVHRHHASYRSSTVWNNQDTDRRRPEDATRGSSEWTRDPAFVVTEQTQDLSVRQFLLTNLLLPSNSQTHGTTHNKAKFIVGLDTIAKSISSLGSFPYGYDTETETAEKTWDGLTLAIKGKASA